MFDSLTLQKDFWKQKSKSCLSYHITDEAPYRFWLRVAEVQRSGVGPALLSTANHWRGNHRGAQEHLHGVFPFRSWHFKEKLAIWCHLHSYLHSYVLEAIWSWTRTTSNFISCAPARSPFEFLIPRPQSSSPHCCLPVPLEFKDLTDFMCVWVCVHQPIHSSTGQSSNKKC